MGVRLLISNIHFAQIMYPLKCAKCSVQIDQYISIFFEYKCYVFDGWSLILYRYTYQHLAHYKYTSKCANNILNSLALLYPYPNVFVKM